MKIIYKSRMAEIREQEQKQAWKAINQMLDLNEKERKVELI